MRGDGPMARVSSVQLTMNGRARQRGVGLLELLLSIGLGGMLLVMLSSVWVEFSAHQTRHVRQSQLQTELALAMYLMTHDLRRHKAHPASLMLAQKGTEAEHSCVLFGELGYRIHQQQLERRQDLRNCEQGHWQAFTERATIRLTKLEFERRDSLLTIKLNGHSAQSPQQRLALTQTVELQYDANSD